VKIEKLEEGMKFKNYKELCKFLEIEVKRGNDKYSQLKEIGRYATIQKGDGHSLYVSAMFDNPTAKVDLRVNNKKQLSNVTQLLVKVLDFKVVQAIENKKTNRENILNKNDYHEDDYYDPLSDVTFGKRELTKLLNFSDFNLNRVENKDYRREHYKFLCEKYNISAIELSEISNIWNERLNQNINKYINQKVTLKAYLIAGDSFFSGSPTVKVFTESDLEFCAIKEISQILFTELNDGQQFLNSKGESHMFSKEYYAFSITHNRELFMSELIKKVQKLTYDDVDKIASPDGKCLITEYLRKLNRNSDSKIVDIEIKGIYSNMITFDKFFIDYVLNEDVIKGLSFSIVNDFIEYFIKKQDKIVFGKQNNDYSDVLEIINAVVMNDLFQDELGK
jgi:hypothetical protein